MRRRRALPYLSLALAVGLVACSEPSTGTEVRSKEPREQADRSTVEPTVTANAAMGADLYHALAPRYGNFVFSPFGVSLALAMAGAGAASATQAQMDAVQHVTPELDLDSGLNTLGQQLADRSGSRSSETRKGRITLNLPAALWGQRDTRFKQPFLDTLARSFGAGVRVVDFRSDPEASRRAMNTWIRDQTHDTIEELVPRGMVTDVTRLVVTGAATVQAPWDVPFDSTRTRPAPFHRLDGSTATVTTMALQASDGLFYARGEGWEAVGLPYLGRQLEMVVLAPDDGRFGEVESALDGAELQRVIGLLRPTALDLRLPRFAFTTQAVLDDPLSEIGLPSAFVVGEADFSGITDDEALAISDMPTQSYLSVDEEGTDASASTVIPSEAPEPTVTSTSVSIARPFIVAVVDRASGEPLFLGRVVDPGS